MIAHRLPRIRRGDVGRGAAAAARRTSTRGVFLAVGATLLPQVAFAADDAPKVQLFNTAELASAGLIPRNDVCGFLLHQADRDPDEDAFPYVFLRLATEGTEGTENGEDGSADGRSGGPFAAFADSAIIQIEGRFIGLAPAAMADAEDRKSVV